MSDPDVAQEAQAAEKLAGSLELAGEHALAAVQYGKAADKWEQEAGDAEDAAKKAAGVAQCRLRCKAGHDYMLAGDDREMEAAAWGAKPDTSRRAIAHDQAQQDYEKAAALLKSCAACMLGSDPAHAAAAEAEAGACFTHIRFHWEKQETAHAARMKRLEDEGKKNTEEYRTFERSRDAAKEKAEAARKEAEEAGKREEEDLKKVASAAEGIPGSGRDELARLEATLAGLQEEVGRLAFFAPAAFPIVADIVKGSLGWTGRSDKIVKKRTDKCTVTVAVDVKYELESSRTETNQEGKVVKTCSTYKVTTKVTVTETCDPGGSTQIGKTEHVSHHEFCDSSADDPATGESVGFDGKETDTLAYPHGTKVTVDKDGEKIKVSVTFPDGTATSLTVPK
ncbi:hypothetical protein [Mesorhizobium comanense]|uniref:hypothetical protein n=1 Tax=Mesorhizobium comanense TaxID=2502215 RepID=UPI0010F73ADA|nr:hypothetical protein [Mesorhizobium comanense]